MRTLICTHRETDVTRLRRLFPEKDVWVTSFSRCPAVTVDRILIISPRHWRWSEAEARTYAAWREWIPTRLSPEALAAGDRILEIEL